MQSRWEHPRVDPRDGGGGAQDKRRLFILQPGKGYSWNACSSLRKTWIGAAEGVQDGSPDPRAALCFSFINPPFWGAKPGAPGHRGGPGAGAAPAAGPSFPRQLHPAAAAALYVLCVLSALCSVCSGLLSAVHATWREGPAPPPPPSPAAARPRSPRPPPEPGAASMDRTGQCQPYPQDAPPGRASLPLLSFNPRQRRAETVSPRDVIVSHLVRAGDA